MQIWRIFVAGKSDTIASSPTSASDMGQSCWHSFNFAWAVAAYEAGSGTGHATGNHKGPGGGLDLRGGAGAAQKAVLGLLGVGADLAPPALAAFATYSDYRSIFQNPLGLI